MSPVSRRWGPGSALGQSMLDLRWTKWHYDRFSSPRFSIVLTLLHIHLNLHAALTRRTNGRSRTAFQKQCAFVHREAWDREYFHFFFYISHVWCHAVPLNLQWWQTNGKHWRLWKFHCALGLAQVHNSQVVETDRQPQYVPL